LSDAADILLTLRRETAPQHARLDGALDFSPARLDRARFGRFLHATAELVGPLEQALDAVPDFAARLPDRERRAKRALLTRDLSALGVSEPVVPAAVPPLTDAAAAFGAAYVLEGSMLGGAVLAKSLGPSLALSREQGLAYLTAYGPELSGMWQRFVVALSAYGAELDGGARARLVASACAVFDAFYTHYAHRGVLVAHH
jgi:heme oxygenase (biliverdin-IX-beta and delta-forming)